MSLVRWEEPLWPYSNSPAEREGKKYKIRAKALVVLASLLPPTVSMRQLGFLAAGLWRRFSLFSHPHLKFFQPNPTRAEKAQDLQQTREGIYSGLVSGAEQHRLNHPKTTDTAFQELHGLSSLKSEAGRPWTVSVGFQPAPLAEDTGLYPMT